MDEIEIYVRRSSLDRVTVTTHYRQDGTRILRSYNTLHGVEMIDLYMRALAERLHRGTVSMVKLEALQERLPF